MKFQNPIIHRSNVSNFTEKWKNQSIKIFKFCFQRDITQKRDITWPYKKIRVNYFIMRNVYMKFQNPSIHCSKVSNFTEKWKNQSNFQNYVFL